MTALRLFQRNPIPCAQCNHYIRTGECVQRARIGHWAEWFCNTTCADAYTAAHPPTNGLLTEWSDDNRLTLIMDEAHD